MKKRLLKRLLLAVLALVIAGVLFIIGFYYSVKAEFFGPLPDADELRDIRNATATLVLSEEGEVIGRIFEENRTNASFDELPGHLVNALVATEDARFFEHEGIDKRSMMRVLVKSIILQDESAGGGSTITQQLAKNLYGRKHHGLLSLPVNKTKEMILANRLEEIYTKEEIIQLYLNTVPFSENTYGIETASQRFFSKKPAELNVEEAAVLVGILKANTYYNPRLNPENSRGRRNVVLQQMARYGYLTEEEADSLMELPLELHYRNIAEDAEAPYFLHQVNGLAEDLVTRYNDQHGTEYDLKQDGLRIITTLNARMQTSAEEAVKEHMNKLQGLFDRHWSGRKPWAQHPQVYERALENSPAYSRLQGRKLSKDSLEYYLDHPHPVLLYAAGKDSVMEMSIRDSVAYYMKLLNAGFLAMTPENGAVKTWVGGLNYQFLPYDHVLAPRQAASTFKPIVYAAALRQGVEPCDMIPNERRRYPDYDDWSPRNYDNEYGGFYSMAGALKKSINVAAVHTLFEAGIGNVIATARQMGITSEIPEEPSIALGTASITLKEMVQAYAVLANGGYRVEPWFIQKIETSSGEVLYEHKPQQRSRVLEEEVAALLNDMLQGVVDEGTGVKLRSVYGLRCSLAGKTGTAQNYTDGWFIGYNPSLVAGAWVGASSPVVHFRSGTYGSGSAMALPIFGKFFRDIQNSEENRKYCYSRFPELSEDLMAQLDCPDFRERNLFDDFRGIFNKDEGKKVKEKKDKEERKGFFKRLFGGKDDKD